MRNLAGGEWRRLPRVPQSGPVGQAARWCETPVAFARLCLCGFETAIAFARWCLCGFETAVAFAGEKWAFLVQFSGAKVMAVSVVPCWGRAVVMVVSCLPASVAAEVSLVAKLPRAGFYARKVRPARSQHPKFGVFALAGRVFSRKCRWRDRAGRTLSRQLALRRSWI